MKKLLSITLIVLLLASLFVGCTNDEPKTDEGTTQNETNKEETKDEPKEEVSTEKQVIKFAAQADSTPATQAVIDAFNSSQEEFVVEWVEFTNDSAQMHDQLITSLSSGSDEYDVLSMDVVWAGEFAGAGYIEPLDVKMSEAGINAADYNAGSMTAGNYKGKQYTLPFFSDLGLLYYRSDIVSAEEAAVLESGDYTYADLAAMAEKYVGEGGTDFGFVYQSKQYEGLTCNVTEFTKGYTDIEAGLETMKTFTEASWTPEDILNYTEGETHTQFTEGKAVFARNWPYQYGIIKGEESPLTPEQTGVAPLPNGGTVGGWLLGLNKNSDVAEGAWTFLQFVTGTEGQKIMATQGGYLPGYNVVLSDEEVKANNEMLQFDGFQKALTSTLSRPVSPEYSKTSDEVQVNTHKYLSGSSDLESTVAALENSLK
ncbi:extracellular solute-binding protein [Vallitalea okinawensis]|uniref:extracellular solute-binding protein n=1 Tax=Vallitalea okinawensis TaxID=2078660 RepID=UPI000CFE2401|nr:extracellular solute-binding protein [Vallitalea okinawensis]